MPFKFLLLPAGLLFLAIQPATAADLGITTDTLLERISAGSEGSDIPLKIQKMTCAENPRPGDETRKIVSCTYMLGDGKLLITNAEPSGPLIDVASQTWEGGENGPAARMISWIAAATSQASAAEFLAGANGIVAEATANGSTSGTLGKAAFFVLSMGDDLVITASSDS